MITTNALLQTRLERQQITRNDINTPGKLLSYMGAMQGQEYLSALWAFGLRLPGTTDADIEKAIAEKEIVRSWGMRATLHFLPPEDIRWILKLVAPRLENKYGSIARGLELDKKTFAKGRKVLEQTLAGGKEMTRKELAVVFSSKGIPTHDIRMGFLLLNATLNGLICFGNRRGKDFTYTLLDEWLPAGKDFNGDEAIAELCFRYFNSHGPATLHDFSWWSGMTLADAKKGVEMNGEKLESVTLDNQQYFISKGTTISSKSSSGTFLLPAYDEYLVSYKNRDAATYPEDRKKLVLRENHIFNPVIVTNGKVQGLWKRTLSKDKVSVVPNLLRSLSITQEKAVQTVAKKYAKFLGMKLEVF